MTTGEFVGVMLTGIGLLAGQVILEVRTMDLSTRLVALEKQHEAEPRYLRMGECQMPPIGISGEEYLNRLGSFSTGPAEILRIPAERSGK